MSRDEAKYPNPNDFTPDRFFMPDGQLNDDTVDFSFGFGRRICTGKHFADASLWIAIVSLLATFRFMRPLNDDGKEVDPIFEWTTGLVSQVSRYSRDQRVLISEIIQTSSLSPLPCPSPTPGHDRREACRYYQP
ncbi:hypothetical protein AZE42_09326 [Rhizopogon vesiculosus]|uniref:Cytochrome P450 n=1 Tax=Rhizopogon vesiculosus TaxID=180088 RepID=A0A1J8QLT9_9AGAM|nr:hypothetical protein AZE42_09326 [Rhizopogon vesiculosus]